MSTPNPIPYHYLEIDPQLTATYDLFEEGKTAEAAPRIVGLPCTYDNGRDQYGGVVLSATPLQIVADLGRLGHKTFRVLSRGSYRVWGNARGSRFVGRLFVGVARTITNPDA